MNKATEAKIRAEQSRQETMWGDGNFAEMSQERVLAVLVEEVGEVARLILEWERDVAGARRIETEIIHVAAVAASWLDECFSDDHLP